MPAISAMLVATRILDVMTFIDWILLSLSWRRAVAIKAEIVSAYSFRWFSPWSRSLGRQWLSYPS